MQQDSSEPILMIRGEKVGLGPIRTDLATTYQRWVNELRSTRTLALASMPMTLEADEVGKGWFEGIGFRTVGRRPAAGGGFRYRMGWYAPRLPQESGYGAH